MQRNICISIFVWVENSILISVKLGLYPPYYPHIYYMYDIRPIGVLNGRSEVDLATKPRFILGLLRDKYVLFLIIAEVQHIIDPETTIQG